MWVWLWMRGCGVELCAGVGGAGLRPVPRLPVALRAEAPAPAAGSRRAPPGPGGAAGPGAPRHPPHTLTHTHWATCHRSSLKWGTAPVSSSSKGGAGGQVLGHASEASRSSFTSSHHCLTAGGSSLPSCGPATQRTGYRAGSVLAVQPCLCPLARPLGGTPCAIPSCSAAHRSPPVHLFVVAKDAEQALHGS